MIPNATARKVEGNDLGVSASFGISLNDSAHIMTILRDTLYSDKVMAVLREYSSNAWDAHRMVGKPDLPIKVTLPTRMQPTLSIRDYGPGLSQDDVMKVYTQYGASTKRNDDNAVGMLGIGSKSGFAYSDSFTITSHHGGKQKTYVAVLDQSDKGEIKLLHEQDSDQTGVEIQIAVKQQDIWEFEGKAKILFKYFDPRPIINTTLQDLPVTKTKLKNGIVFDLEENSYLDIDTNWVAVMGCVPYRINLSQLQSSEGGVSPYLSKMTGALHFKIGEVQISASREELKYSTATKTALIDKFNVLVEEYVRITLDTLDAADQSQWDRRLKAQILGKFQLPVPKKYENLTESYITFEMDDKQKEMFSFYKNREIQNHIHVNANSRIILRDDTRAIQGFSLTDYDRVVRLNPDNKKITWDKAQKHVDKVIEKADIEGIQILKMSTMPWTKPIRKLSARPVDQKHHVRTFRFVPSSGSYYGKKSNHWKIDDRVPTDEDVFVIIKEFDGAHYSFIEHYREDFRLAEALDVKMPEVYGYKTTKKKPLEAKDLKGTDYEEWRKTFIESLLTPERKEQLVAWMYLRSASERVNYYGYSTNREDVSKKILKIVSESLGADHPITAFYRKRVEAKEIIRSVLDGGLTLLHNRAQSRIGKLEPELKLEEFNAKYPLLMVNNLGIANLWVGNPSMWAEYIKLIDQKGTSNASTSVHPDK